MSSRRRLGVALVIDAPLAVEIDGLRRAVGDRALARIAPHVTLVPPVNVRGADLPAALEVVRLAAARCGRPLTLTLGPPATFLPANPVLHLPVGGDLPALRSLRDAVFAGPLVRTLAWPWVPHVTLADDVDPARIAAATSALAGYQVAASFDRVVLLEQRRRPASPGDPGGRQWVPFADADLAPATVVGRGGREVRLVTGREVGPDVTGLLAAAEIDAAAGPAAPGSSPGPFGNRSVVVTGLVDRGRCAGVAQAWSTPAGPAVAVFVAPGERSGGIGRHLLVALEDLLRRRHCDAPVLRAVGPAGFYQACSAWAVPVA